VNPQPISDQTWAGIRTEFTLPTLEQVRHRLSELMEDPEPVVQQLVRVFIRTIEVGCPNARPNRAA
jgi:hypothetical protein